MGTATTEHHALRVEAAGDRAQYLEALRIQVRRRQPAAVQGDAIHYADSRIRIDARLDTGELRLEGPPSALPWEWFLDAEQQARAHIPRALGRALLMRACGRPCSKPARRRRTLTRKVKP